MFTSLQSKFVDERTNSAIEVSFKTYNAVLFEKQQTPNMVQLLFESLVLFLLLVIFVEAKQLQYYYNVHNYIETSQSDLVSKKKKKIGNFI